MHFYSCVFNQRDSARTWTLKGNTDFQILGTSERCKYVQIQFTACKKLLSECLAMARPALFCRQEASLLRISIENYERRNNCVRRFLRKANMRLLTL